MTSDPIALWPRTDLPDRSHKHHTSADTTITQATTESVSLREVGEAVGLSHTAVKFIAHGRQPSVVEEIP